MNAKAVSAVFRKEMLEMVRDRRTLISMVVVPIAAMPLLFVVMGRFMSSTEAQAQRESVNIALQGAERVPGMLNALAGAGFRFVLADDLRGAVNAKTIAAGVEVLEDASGVGQVKVYADMSRQASAMAARRIGEALDRLRENGIRYRLRELGIPENVLNPFQVERVNVAPEKRMAGMLWGGMFGYVVVLLMFTGGMYPAIDITAGEKERRTLEVLLACPAARGDIILGKILSVTAAVAATAVLSVVSLVASFRYVGFGGAPNEVTKMMREMPIDPVTGALAVASLVPTAVMAASLMVAISLFAKSFKEAQSYLTPLIMAAIFPLVIGVLPGVHLTPALALVPVFNICQLIKEIFQGDYRPLTMGITLAANCAYAAAAYVAAVRIFKEERVLFRS